MTKRECIECYFKCWLTKDDTKFDQLFAKDIVYYECYGPYYQGLNTLHKWFQDWNRFGTVIEWEIKEWIEQDQSVAVTWYFHTMYEGEEDAFDGVSIVFFDEENHMMEVREYQSTLPHVQIQ